MREVYIKHAINIAFMNIVFPAAKKIFAFRYKCFNSAELQIERVCAFRIPFILFEK